MEGDFCRTGAAEVPNYIGLMDVLVHLSGVKVFPERYRKG